MPNSLRSCVLARLALASPSVALVVPAARAGVDITNAPPLEPQSAAASAAAVEPTTDRLIVKLRDRPADVRGRVAELGAAIGERLEHVREMSGDAHVLRLPRRVGRLEAEAIARRLAADPRVELAEPDAVMQPLRVPNDTMYQQQWHYYEAAGGINLPGAWDVTTGSAAITVAVIDTGVRPHADLAPRLVAGYDFIADASKSNDGTGRDGDAYDPGDFGCNGSKSSWHGTHVAGTLGAMSNNGTGVAGINWASHVQPVRVLGRCGGYTSDIVDGMRWAAGIAVPNAPANRTPARVENLSLGGSGACSATFQSAINDVVARRIVVVVAAGNSNVDAANAQPASCSNVVTVAATTRNGGRASYSNYGSKVTIAAPGGGGSSGILSTLNSGTTTPGADSYAWFQGTSMATPHVAGVVSLMLSVNPSLTPADVTQRLRQSARAFPKGTGADCTTTTCGAGILNAAAALAGLKSPTVATSTAGWSRVAAETESFTVSGTQTVRYGSGGRWVMRSITGTGTCSSAFFGTDPAPAVAKECQVAD